VCIFESIHSAGCKSECEIERDWM